MYVIELSLIKLIYKMNNNYFMYLFGFTKQCPVPKITFDYLAFLVVNCGLALFALLDINVGNSVVLPTM